MLCHYAFNLRLWDQELSRKFLLRKTDTDRDWETEKVRLGLKLTYWIRPSQNHRVKERKACGWNSQLTRLATRSTLSRDKPQACQEPSSDHGVSISDTFTSCQKSCRQPASVTVTLTHNRQGELVFWTFAKTTENSAITATSFWSVNCSLCRYRTLLEFKAAISSKIVILQTCLACCCHVGSVRAFSHVVQPKPSHESHDFQDVGAHWESCFVLTGFVWNESFFFGNSLYIVIFIREIWKIRVLSPSY